MIRQIIYGLLFVLTSLPLVVNGEVEVKPDHPKRYVVKKGDTLWDIAGKFLKYPWHWPEIWIVNPKIENPHLIYPGDELVMTICDGRPCIKVNRGSRTVKLSPQVREIMIDKPVPTISLAALKPFLDRPRVVGDEVLENAPYVVSSADERILSGAGDYVYARSLVEGVKTYSVFRGGQPYTDPETEEILGYEAIYVGDAVVDRTGDPAKILLTQTSKEVLTGDRLLGVETEDYDLYFTPSVPGQAVNGRILSVFDGVSQIGQYQVVVLSCGLRDGLEAGNVLSVYKVGESIRDQVSRDMVTLPDEHVGEAMIFKLYEKVSYAVVMRATNVIHIHDKVSSVE